MRRQERWHEEKKVTKRNVSLKIGKLESRTGGLTAAGRRKYNAATGSNLKAPQPGGGARKRSFCARMSGVKGPMKKNGKPTRKALALRKMEVLIMPGHYGKKQQLKKVAGAAAKLKAKEP